MSEASAKTAIVIGATGLVGHALVEQLSNEKNFGKIIAVTRRPVKFRSSKVENQVVDFNHLEKHAGIFQGDYLFSCLGTTKKQAGSIEAQRKVDLDYQLTVAKLAAANGVPHYLLVSSAGANERSNNDYLQMKGELEAKALALPFKRVSIFRPSLLLGDREKARTGEKLAATIMPMFTFLPGIRRYRPIRGEQVAQKMIQVSQHNGPAKERFTLDEVFPQL